MPRLFTGIAIPGEIADRLMLLRGEVPGARWISRENYHVTLRFLGDVSEAVASEYVSRVERLLVEPFELKMRSVGYFGNRKPNTLWAGVMPSDPLSALARLHEKAAVAVGLEPEKRNFTPHVTLARLGRTRADNLATFLRDFSDFELPPFPVERTVLYSSRPSTGGGPYVIEQEFPFLGED